MDYSICRELYIDSKRKQVLVIQSVVISSLLQSLIECLSDPLLAQWTSQSIPKKKFFLKTAEKYKRIKTLGET